MVRQGEEFMAKSKKSDEVAEALGKPLGGGETPSLPTGSTLVNLALSGKPDGGWRTGHLFLLVGDSQAGKTWIGLASLAEASIHPAFRDYRLIHFDTEGGALMSIRDHFGPKLAARLETERPTTLEELYFRLDDLADEGKPFVAVVDSMDSLSSSADDDKFDEDKKAFAAGKEAGGSFGVSKAKVNSTRLRTVTNALAATKSIALMVCQTRQNLGFGSQFNPKVRAGGNSLKFYATGECWFSIKEKVTRRVHGVNRNVGSLVEVAVKKNRQTGWEPKVRVPILHGSGIDDTGSMVLYLIEEKHWAGNDVKVTAPEFDHDGTIESLVGLIEAEGREQELRILTASVWAEVEDACRVKRKPRYGQEEV
jgi:RecA/RadA recombinase